MIDAFIKAIMPIARLLFEVGTCVLTQIEEKKTTRKIESILINRERLEFSLYLVFHLA